MALMKDSRVRILVSVCLDVAAATALRPVSSPMRRRAEDTAGALAPRRGIKPRATVTQAIVLAVPMTPHVPAYTLSITHILTIVKVLDSHCRRQLLIDPSNLLHINRTSPIFRPITPTIRASPDPGPLKTTRHHRTRHKRNKRLIRRYPTHDLRGDRLIAACTRNQIYESGHQQRSLDTQRSQQSKKPQSQNQDTGCLPTSNSNNPIHRLPAHHLLRIHTH